MTPLALADETVRTLAVAQPYEQALDAARDSLVAASCALQDAEMHEWATWLFRQRARMHELEQAKRALVVLSRLAEDDLHEGALLAVARAEFAVLVLVEAHVRESNLVVWEQD